MSQGRILYVHGAGTRADQAASNAALLRTRLGLDGTPDRLAVSDWGQSLGTDPRLLEMDRALPDYSQPALHVAGMAAHPTATLPDALAPLRAMAVGRRGAAATQPRDADALLAFMALGGIDLSAHGLPANRLSDAARDVAASPEYEAARGDAVALIDATAISTLARAVERDPGAVGRVGILGLDLGWLADRAGDLAATILGGGLLSVVESWIVPQLTPALSLWASKRLAPRRRAFMHDHILVAADVLRYQRHGEQIREHVRAEIQALDTPRLVMGHSLGGIIAVDTLFGPDATDLGVSLLVTFGSQSAMLAAIDALDPVKPTIPWLNLWATYDFVSFLDAGLWPGVEDHEIVLDVGFPAAHGAYYESDELARQVRSHPAAAGIFA
jgi:hypothetical protein